MKDFMHFLESRSLVILDGAMGTQLDKRGLMGRGRTNLDSPEAVLEIHREYADAGSDALTTNTLTMNRIFIETHSVGVSVREVNEAGVRLAREIAGDRLFVLGDMCSTGQLLEPYGEYTEDQFYRTFREQAEVLAEAGVDAFIIETMFDLHEVRVALKACKDVGSLPVIVSMAFATEANGGRTMMGNSAEECARQLTDAGADVIGANCGDLEPLQMARVVSILRSAASLPILAQPNAGKPKLIGGETVFDMGAEEFAAGLRECVGAGAKLIGGCCGTSPEHIRALAKDKDR
ncbi:MAG TPA: homocysteine S-methyltransferase family protein [Armatimonadota bacterium]|nr:homocysteine S-methyltransferase family protein [Armatimonadota bacterium]